MRHFSDALMVELTKIMEHLDPDQWGHLEKLLAEGKGGTMYGALNLPPLGDESAQEIMEAAASEVRHWWTIQNHRKNLHESIADALKRIGMAQREIKQLGELGDVEYDGGSADLEAFLADAARLLRAGQALKPTDAKGE